MEEALLSKASKLQNLSAILPAVHDPLAGHWMYESDFGAEFLEIVEEFLGIWNETGPSSWDVCLAIALFWLVRLLYEASSLARRRNE